MRWTSILAIYILFWVLSAFLVMPFGVRSPHEDNVALVPGQCESAPANFDAKRILIRTTIVAVVLFGLYYANYVEGWVSPEAFNLYGHPPDYDGTAA